EIVADNDIIHEVIIRPADVVPLENIEDLKVNDGDIVEKGTEILPGYKVDDRKMISLIEKEEAATIVLVRPVYEFFIEPKDTKFKYKSSDEKISLRPVT